MNRWQQRPDRRLAGDAAALAGWLGLAAGLAGWQGFTSLLPAAMGLVLLGSLSGRGSASLLSIRPIYLVGGMCYTLYLYHFYVISAVGSLLLPYMEASQPLWLNVMLMTACVAPVVLVSGALLFVAVEKPFMAWRPGKPR